MRFIGRQNLSAKQALPTVKKVAEKDSSEKNRCYAIRVVKLINPDNKGILAFLEQRKNNDKSEKVKNLCGKLIAKIIGTSGRAAFNFGDKIDSETSLQKDVEIIFDPDFSFYNGYKVKHLTSLGILPINFEIKNNSRTAFFVDVESIKLFDENHVEAKKLNRNTVIEMQKYSVAKSVIIGFPGVSLANAIKANVRIANYCNKTVLKACKLEPQSSMQGYLYFDVPKKIKNIAYWVVHCNVENVERQISYSIKYTFGGEAIVQKKELAVPVNMDKYKSFVTEGNVALENSLIQLKNLYTKGLISEREYREKKNELLQRF